MKQTKKHILDASIQLFNERGFVNIRLQNIADARDVNPEIKAMTVSGLTGEGIDEWCEWLVEMVKQKKDKEVLA